MASCTHCKWENATAALESTLEQNTSRLFSHEISAMSDNWDLTYARHKNI